MRELRIHHFIDIIRDYGDDKTLTPHEYGHSYHRIGNEIYSNKLEQFRVIIDNDDICQGCRYLESGRCLDTISHRSDFKSKEAFNTFLDRRIMNVLGYREGQILQVSTVLEDMDAYQESIFDIYEGNDVDHTEQRKKNVSRGMEMKKRELTYSGGEE